MKERFSFEKEDGELRIIREKVQKVLDDLGKDLPLRRGEEVMIKGLKGRVVGIKGRTIIIDLIK